MDATVLLTGGSGFLGAHLARELLAQRYRVRVLLRGKQRPPTLAGLPVDYCDGDILDKPSLIKAVSGCDAVIHAAALAQVNPARNPAVWSVNVTGTENMLEAVRRPVFNDLFTSGRPTYLGSEQKRIRGTKLFRLPESAMVLITSTVNGRHGPCSGSSEAGRPACRAGSSDVHAG